MTREQMVEKAAQHLFRHSTATELDYPYLPGKFRWGQQSKVTQQRAREVAASVLDAVLPQVTTLDALEALDDQALLLGNRGVVTTAGQLRKMLKYDPDIWPTPLTVVWQP